MASDRRSLGIEPGQQTCIASDDSLRPSTLPMATSISALGNELTHQPQWRSAQRAAHAISRPPALGAYQQQARHIHAGNQQQQCGPGPAAPAGSAERSPQSLRSAAGQSHPVRRSALDTALRQLRRDRASDPPTPAPRRRHPSAARRHTCRGSLPQSTRSATWNGVQNSGGSRGAK